jgi:hypothetical protein
VAGSHFLPSYAPLDLWPLQKQSLIKCAMASSPSSKFAFPSHVEVTGYNMRKVVFYARHESCDDLAHAIARARVRRHGHHHFGAPAVASSWSFIMVSETDSTPRWSFRKSIGVCTG